jgi:4-amino-4-deoxy-L-arabinose transferase-like glycosyltransferase
MIGSPRPREDATAATNGPRDRPNVPAAGSRILAAVILVMLLGALYLRGLGAVDIIGDDEAREVGIIQDIVRGGHWILPHFNTTTLPDKPILYHWLGAIACGFHQRCDETAVRLPSALAALTLTGITALLLLGLSPFLFDRARLARPDVLMTLALTVALLTFHRWWEDGGTSRRGATTVGVLLGIAVLAKGPVAPIIAALTIIAFLSIRGDLRLGRSLLRPNVLVPFLAVGGAWYAAALIGWGDTFIRDHLLGRYVGNIVGGDMALGVRPSHSWFHHVSFYPLHLLLGTLPWTPLFVAAVIAAWRDPGERADARVQFLQVWVLSVVVVFSFAAFKLRHYVLPALPAAAMLAAPLTARLVRDGVRRPPPGTRRGPMGSIIVVGLVAGAAVIWWLAGGVDGLSRSDREIARAIEPVVRAHPGWAVAIAATALTLSVAGVEALRSRQWHWLVAVGIAGVLFWMLVVQTQVQSALASRGSLKGFAAEVTTAVPADEPLYFFGRELRPLVVYVGRPIQRLRRDLDRAGDGRSHVIVTETDLPRLRRSRRPIRTIAEQVSRIGNLERGRVLLVEVGPSDESVSPK